MQQIWLMQLISKIQQISANVLTLLCCTQSLMAELQVPLAGPELSHNQGISDLIERYFMTIIVAIQQSSKFSWQVISV